MKNGVKWYKHFWLFLAFGNFNALKTHSLKSMESYNQIFSRFQKYKQKVPVPSPLFWRKKKMYNLLTIASFRIGVPYVPSILGQFVDNLST